MDHGRSPATDPASAVAPRVHPPVTVCIRFSQAARSRPRDSRRDAADRDFVWAGGQRTAPARRRAVIKHTGLHGTRTKLSAAVGQLGVPAIANENDVPAPVVKRAPVEVRAGP